MIFIKKVLSYNFSVLLASFAFFTAGLLLISNQKAEAATEQNYTEKYTVSMWRNCKDSLHAKNYWELSVGPAEWKVTGNIGTSSFEETWTVEQWRDSGSIKLGSQEYNNVSGVTCYNSPSLSKYTATSTRVGLGDYRAVSGMYALSYHGYEVSNYNAILEKDIKKGHVSMPMSWKITGKIKTQ